MAEKEDNETERVTDDLSELTWCDAECGTGEEPQGP